MQVVVRLGVLVVGVQLFLVEKVEVAQELVFLFLLVEQAQQILVEVEVVLVDLVKLVALEVQESL
tara:strand:+ start:519 stop:713 length:195 start_codon:yes stop_codon:yes gene_type:complete